MSIVIMPYPVCPHCGIKNVAFHLIAQVHNNKIPVVYYQLWSCGNCEMPACSRSVHLIKTGGNHPSSLLGFFPIPQEITAPYGTPKQIASTFRSAKRYFKSGCDADYDATCFMARKGIELAVNELGGEGKNLFQKINDLETKRLIPPAMREWAQHLRDIGNDGAHEPIVTRDDAQQAVYFAEMLFTYLYTLPKKMAEYQEKS